MKIGYITLIDPEMNAAKQDNFSLEVRRVISTFFIEPSEFVEIRLPNEAGQIKAALIRLCDEEKCPLVLTTGGMGPGAHDMTPDMTTQIVDRELPGFGEIMRYYSYERFKVAVVSRATAGVRGQSLIINLPARPKPIRFCLRLLQEGIAEALEQITGKKTALRGDEIVIPMEKYLPFLKWIRPKFDPAGDKHPSL